MFGVVYQADSVIQTDLEEWNRVANENVNQAVQALEEDSPLQRRIEQNARVVLLIQSESLASPADFRGVRDSRKTIMTPKEEKYEKELEELEFKVGGVFAISTPDGHKKRWDRKNKLVRREISAAETLEEKQRLSQKLIDLKRTEKKLGEKLAALHANFS